MNKLNWYKNAEGEYGTVVVPNAPHRHGKSSRPLASSSSPLSSESAASCATRRRSSRSSRVLAGPARLMNGCSSSWCALQR